MLTDIAGRAASVRGSAGRMASRSISGSSRSIPSSRPPLAAPPTCPSSVSTSRTGLTEDQLKDMLTRTKRSSTPSFSETVNKRRRLDAVIERNSDFLSRQDNDASGSGGNDSLIVMLMIPHPGRSKWVLIRPENTVLVAFHCNSMSLTQISLHDSLSCSYYTPEQHDIPSGHNLS